MIYFLELFALALIIFCAFNAAINSIIDGITLRRQRREEARKRLQAIDKFRYDTRHFHDF